MADRYQDMMGFTVTGPSTFLASGRPSPADPDATSPHLGLVRSTDAGQTWTTLSVEGEADFHSLQPAGPVLYGFDSQSGKAWASTDDGRTWDQRAGLPLFDLAAHADTPHTVRAATGKSLERSTDGARTFQSVSGAPALVAIEEHQSGMLVALAADGRVMRGHNAGTWSEQGRLPQGGEATVLTAVTARELLAADSAGTVCGSTDAGRTRSVLHSRPLPRRSRIPQEYP